MVSVLFGLLCAATFLTLVCGALYASYLTLSSLDYRLIWRTMRRGRFGLRTAFGGTAVVGVAFGMLHMLGVEMDNLGVLCPLAIAVPLALYIVAFLGLALAELFDAKTTRSLIARRNLEEGFPGLVRDASSADPPDTPFDELDKLGADSDGPGAEQD